MYAFITDHITALDLPLIQADDRGLLLGDGLFETLKVINGIPLFFSQHFARLQQSAHFLSIPLLFSQEALLAICQQVLEANKLEKTITALRITLTRGCSSRGIDVPTECHPTLLVTTSSYQPTELHPRAFITSIPRNERSPLIQHKTLNYLEFILARKIAKETGFDEGILINTAGAVTESAIANIFLVLKEEVITPRLEDGILPGITRRQVFECCHTANISIHERKIMPQMIQQATEGFQTNSLIGIQTFSSIDQHPLHYGKAAEVTQRIVAAYKAMELEECL
jgi:branched-chain amino acid aminotransferase